MEFQWHDIERDAHGWDRRVARGDQCLFNLSALLSVHAFQGAQRRGVVVTDAGRPRAVIGGLVREGQGGRSFESLCFPRAAEEEPGLVGELVRWLRSEGIEQVRLGSFVGGVEDYALDADGFTLSERLEFPWDLSLAESERRQQLRSNHKRKLNKLDKQALTVRRIDRQQPWILTRARAQWAQRKGEGMGLRELWRLYGYHRLLHKHLTRAGIANLYGLYDEHDTLLSVAYMLEYGSLSFYMIGASSPEGYRTSASMKLFWEMARYYTEKGFRYLHLGGVPSAALAKEHEEHGVYRFKHGFGITPAVRLTLSTHR